jgi:NIMA (never in mitosis gene a)-related kinase
MPPQVAHVNKKFASASFSDFYDIKELYRSGAGAVYCAKYKYDKQKYVLKERTLPELGKRKDMMNEVNLLSQLDHENVVKCEGFFRDGERKSLFIVLEYCKGGDLKSLLDKKKAEGQGLEERLIWHIFLQLCNGLKHLHENGIVHRDLKTMNVMIVRDERRFIVKIADLGVSRQISEDTMMLQTFYGTPLYLSPELVENKAYNEKTDIWSLGIILYELCSLKHPFMSNTLIGLAKRIVAGTYEPIPREYSHNLSRCLKWMMKPEFGKRPNCVQLIQYAEKCVTPPGYPWADAADGGSNAGASKGVYGKGKLQILVDDDRKPRDKNRGENKHEGEDDLADGWAGPGTADTGGGEDDLEDTYAAFGGNSNNKRRGANLSGAGRQARPGTAGESAEADSPAQQQRQHQSGRSNASVAAKKNKNKDQLTVAEREQGGGSNNPQHPQQVQPTAAEQHTALNQQAELQNRFGDKLGHRRKEQHLILEDREAHQIIGESIGHHNRSVDAASASLAPSGAPGGGDEGANPDPEMVMMKSPGVPPMLLPASSQGQRERASTGRVEYKKYAVFDLKAKKHADRMEPVAGVGGWAADGSNFPSMEEVDKQAANLERDGDTKHALKMKKEGKYSPRRDAKDMVAEDGHLMGSPREDRGGTSYVGKAFPRRAVPDADGGRYGASTLHVEDGSIIGSEHHQKQRDAVHEARKHRDRERALANWESVGHDDQEYIDMHYNAHRQERAASNPNRESVGHDDQEYDERHYDKHRADLVKSLPNKGSEVASNEFNSSLSPQGGSQSDRFALRNHSRKQSQPAVKLRPEDYGAAGMPGGAEGEEEVPRRREQREVHRAHIRGSLEVDHGQLVGSPTHNKRPSSARATAQYSPKPSQGHPQDRNVEKQHRLRAKGASNPYRGDSDDGENIPQAQAHPMLRELPKEKPNKRREMRPPTGREREQAEYDRQRDLDRERYERLPGHVADNLESRHDDQEYAERQYNKHRADRVKSLPGKESDSNDDYDAEYVAQHYDPHRADRVKSLPNKENSAFFLNKNFNRNEQGQNQQQQHVQGQVAPAPAPPAAEPQPASAVQVDAAVASLLLKKELQSLRRLRKTKDFLGLSEGHPTQQLQSGSGGGSKGEEEARKLLSDIEACKNRIRELERAVDLHWMEREKVDTSFPKLRPSSKQQQHQQQSEREEDNPREKGDYRERPTHAQKRHVSSSKSGPSGQQRQREQEEQEQERRRDASRRKAYAIELAADLEEKRGRAGPGREGVHAQELAFNRGGGGRGGNCSSMDGNSCIKNSNLRPSPVSSPERDPAAFLPGKRAGLFDRDVNYKQGKPVVVTNKAQSPRINNSDQQQQTVSLAAPPSYANNSPRRPSGQPRQHHQASANAVRHAHEPEAVVEHVIQDASEDKRLHAVARNNYREKDDGNAVNAKYGISAHEYQRAVLKDEEDAKARRMDAIGGFKDGRDRPFTAAESSRTGKVRNDRDNSRHPKYQQQQEMNDRRPSSSSGQQRARSASPRDVSRPRQPPRNREVRFEQLYEPAGLMVKGLFRGFERDAGAGNNHYSSKEKLPPADMSGKEREAAVAMFGFNGNTTPRFHRQAPVSSGAAYHAVRASSNSYVPQEGELRMVTSPEVRAVDGMHADDGGFRLW